MNLWFVLTVFFLFGGIVFMKLFEDLFKTTDVLTRLTLLVTEKRTYFTQVKTKNLRAIVNKPLTITNIYIYILPPIKQKQKKIMKFTSVLI